jgi:hypothetical protein
VLSERQATRLADRAGRRREDGTRGLAARRAWHVLMAGGDGGDQNAAEAVWQAWLDELDEERWQVLARWREPGALAEAVFGTAVDPDRPASSRAAIGAFCAGHGLAPGDDVQRAVFFVLTGRPEQHRALDPDGGALAAAYREAAAPTRAALREAIADAGELDLLRVVAGSDEPARIARLATAEREYLADQLARRGDWERLWRLICAAPLPEAAAAARLLPDGQPGEAAARRLARRLAAAEPVAVAVGLAMLRKAAVTQLTHEQKVVCGSFAADGSRVVICSPNSGPSYSRWAGIRVFPLPGYNPADRIIGVGTLYRGAVLDLGPDRLVVEDRTGSYRLTGFYSGQPVLLSRGHQPYPSNEEPYPFRPLIRLDGGFVTSADGTALLIGRPPAETVGQVTPGELGLPWADCWPLASDPGSGRLAVRGGGELAVLDASLGVIARGPDPGQTDEAAFTGAGRLVTASITGLTSWRLEGRALVREASADGWFSHLTALPGHGQVAALGPRSFGQPAFRLTVFDAGDLSVADEPAGPAGKRANCVWGSPDGNLIAAAYGDGTVLVHDWVFRRAARVADRTIAEMLPADLAAVAAAHDRDPEPQVREALRLLRACLYYRFGTEVAVGRTVTAGPDDIALRCTGAG